jgi:nicotinate-nucleotide adenylyltransferase
VRIGLYGGSFDPIHYGHLVPVRAARRELALDRVVYLPTGRPPHKSPRVAPAEHRFAMVELALAAEEGCVVCRHELDESRPSFTIDTVERFRRERLDDEPVLLVGADSWHDFESWRDWRRLLDLVELAVLVRPGREPPPGELVGERAAAVERGRVRFVANQPLEISSRDLRRRLRRGEEISRHEVPLVVLDYIRKYDLYRS